MFSFMSSFFALVNNNPNLLNMIFFIPLFIPP